MSNKIKDILVFKEENKFKKGGELEFLNISLDGPEVKKWITPNSLRDEYVGIINNWVENKELFDALLMSYEKFRETEFNTRTGYGSKPDSVGKIISTTGGKKALLKVLETHRDEILKEKDILPFLLLASGETNISIDTINDFIIVAMLDQLKDFHERIIDEIHEDVFNNQNVKIQEKSLPHLHIETIKFLIINGQEIILLPKSIFSKSKSLPNLCGFSFEKTKGLTTFFKIINKLTDDGYSKHSITTLIKKCNENSKLDDLKTKDPNSIRNKIIKENKDILLEYMKLRK